MDGKVDGLPRKDKAVREKALSVEERATLIVERSFTFVSLYAADGTPDLERMAESAAQGLSSTSEILSNVAKSTETMGIWDYLKKAGEIGSQLSSIYGAAMTVYGIIAYIRDFGKPSQFEQIKAKLDEISKTLKRVEEDIQKGFASLIAHADFAEFRKSVAEPTQILFDAYTRCFTVPGESPIVEFKKKCKDDFKPRDILSIIYNFLTTQDNIFASQLRADKHSYLTFKTWTNSIFHHAIRLITINHFYYGLVAAESPENKKNEMEEFAKAEMNDLIGQLVRMGDRLKQIELDRLKSFHSTGDGKQWIKEVFDRVKPKSVDPSHPFPPGFLPKLARDFEEQWKIYNGPLDFYVVICRGRYGGDGTCFRQAGFHIEDNKQVTVYPNIAYENSHSNHHEDGLMLALIQPITDEIREANRSDHHADLEKIFKKHCHERYPIASTKDEIFKLTPEKPLLILYNADVDVSREQEGVVRTVDHADKSIGEAWSAPGGPFPKKYTWYKHLIAGPYDPDICYVCRHMQVIFQKV